MARLFLIEGNAVVSGGLLVNLGLAGHEALAASTASAPEQIILQARALQPDYIILNPFNGEGFSLLSDLLDHPETKHIPLIALSAGAGSAAAARLRRLGALCHYDTGQLTGEELAERIGQIIKNRAVYETQR